MNVEGKQALDIVDATLKELVERATNSTIRLKLQNLHSVLHHLVVNGKQRLTVPLVVQTYAARIHAKEQSLAEPSIRNKRGGANPYHGLYRAWEAASEVILRPRKQRGGPLAAVDLVGDEDLARLNPELKHRVALLAAQNRSYKAQLDILRRAREAPTIYLAVASKLEGVPPAVANRQTLSEAEVSALKDFVAARRMRARGLRQADDGSIETLEGRRLTDPGFLDALEKIVKIYNTGSV